MSLSKEQKALAIEQLTSQFKTIRLKCDDYEITLKLERFQMKLIIAIYVNGVIKGIWSTKPGEHPESKFLRTCSRSCYSAKQKALIIKEVGKRQAIKHFDINKKFEYKLPYFNTAQSALNHLVKVSNSVELLTEVQS